MKVVAAALLCDKEGRYLLCQRLHNDPLALKWEFPGGKLEKNETPEACLVREVREELTIEVEVIGHFFDTIYKYDTSEILLKFYFAKIVRGDIRLLVHANMAWVKPTAILQYDLLPADVKVVEKLIKRDLIQMEF